MDIESSRVEGLRVRVFRDEDPGELGDQGDHLPLIVSVPKPNRDGSPVIETGDQWVRDFDVTRVAWAVRLWAKGNVREEPTARYLWLAYGVRAKLIHTASDGDTWWAVATPSWIGIVLGSDADVDAALEESAQFVREWCAGEIYCYQVEYEAEWTHHATGLKRQEWQPLENGDYSSSSMVGYDHAMEEARGALAEVELEQPIVCPQARPHYHRPRQLDLWKAVAEPATLEAFTVVGHEHEREVAWSYWLECGTNDAVQVDAARIWMALVACATGAMRVDAALALECRDLVTCDWSRYRAALSPQAADAVFHLAVCGDGLVPNPT
jgi:hypothetical protein